MEWVERVVNYFKSVGIYGTTMSLGDVLEILIVAFLLYYVLAWMKNTRAWLLLKGFIMICVFLVVAYLLDMSTIMWMARNILGFAVTAIIVVMQPELRHALEELGKKAFIPTPGSRDQGNFSERTINEITKACVEMGKVKTGALIVIEQKETLKDYERTGIEVDGLVTNQLLINIFEHNTPLHDGAAIIRGNRVTSATCYLPLSDNLSLSKELGTRHRAGVGISEVTDSLTIIVSEETGKISVACEGKLERGLDGVALKNRLELLLNDSDGGNRSRRKWMGRSRRKNEKKDIS